MSSVIDVGEGPAVPNLKVAPARLARGGRRMRLLVAAGAVTAVAAAGVTAVLVTQPASGGRSALAAVTSAVARSSTESYSFSLESTVRFAGREINSDVVTGAFDPRHELGAELLTVRGLRSAKARIRFVGKYVYTWLARGSGLKTIGKPWDKATVPSSAADVLPVGDRYGFSSARPVSPAELLVILRSAATVRDDGPASGPGWTGTRYAFKARLSARYSVSGTAYVDQQGQVRRLVTTTTQGMKLTMSRDLTFGAFGTPVSVTAPPASQVTYTSGKPYWGFFF
jgi:hypothetical protein